MKTVKRTYKRKSDGAVVERVYVYNEGEKGYRKGKERKKTSYYEDKGIFYPSITKTVNGVRRKKSVNEYREEFYRINKQTVDRSEAIAQKRREGTEYIPSKYTYLERLFNPVINFTKSSIINVVGGKLVDESYYGPHNFIEAMKRNDYAAYTTFINAIRSHGDNNIIYSRFKYLGDSTYRYTCEDGSTVTVVLLDSPLVYEVYDGGEMIYGFAGE